MRSSRRARLVVMRMTILVNRSTVFMSSTDIDRRLQDHSPNRLCYCFHLSRLDRCTCSAKSEARLLVRNALGLTKSETANISPLVVSEFYEYPACDLHRRALRKGLSGFKTARVPAQSGTSSKAGFVTPNVAAEIRRRKQLGVVSVSEEDMWCP